VSVFTELLRIAGFRESKAETAVSAARGVVARAHEDEQAARRVLQEFLAYSERHERELYSDLCTRLIKLRELEEVQLSVLDLRNGERQREAAVEAARKAVEQAQAALEAAREVHRLAMRMKEKFVELASSYDEERMKELQRIEDLEMEEVHRVTLDREEREEWEQSHGGEP
jgi:type III secretion protein O